MKATMIWLIVSAALVSACDVGDFCDVVPGEKLFDPATADAMVQTDREDVVQIGVENAYGRAHCDW